MKRIIICLASALIAAATLFVITARNPESDGFVQEADFTVEFHNGNKEYVIGGYETVTVGDVLAGLGIADNGDIRKVSFSDPSLIAVAENSGEWTLKSLAPFDTYETLRIRYSDGRVEEYSVTDDHRVNYNWTVADINTDGFYWSVQEGGINYHTLTVVNESGTVLAQGKTKTQDVITSGWFHLSSQDYWFEYKSDEHMGTGIYTLTGNEHIISIPIYNRNNAASTVTAHSSFIFSGDQYTVKIASKFVKKNDTDKRDVKTYVNGNLVDSQTEVLFPKRGVSSADPDTPVASDVTVSYDSNKYSGYEVEVKAERISIGNWKYTYKIYLTTKYSVSFAGNGATSGSMSNQAFAYGTAQSLTSNAYKKEYTVTFDANGGTTGTSSLTSSATFKGWEDRGSINYEGTNYPYTQFDAPYYANTNGDVYDVVGYNKYSLIQHYFLFGQGEGRHPVGPVPGLYPNAATVNNLCSDAGGVTPLYASWSDMPAVTLPSASKSGCIFDGWFTAATGGTLVGVAGASYTPSSDVTLYAHFSSAMFALTITETGLGAGESAVITVTKSGESAPMYTVSLGAGGTSVTIKDVPMGTYVIASKGWSRAYTVNTASFEKNIDKDTEVAFVYTARTDAPRHAEAYSISWK